MTAIPSTEPIWRMLDITPEACPAFSGATEPITAEVMGGMTIPIPKPETAKGSTMLGHDASGTMTRRVR